MKTSGGVLSRIVMMQQWLMFEVKASSSPVCRVPVLPEV